uniref:Uncharacterized protein n=1 Tax=Ditylenchus dipsaci TaxID=166011 RepID=A0A915DQX9_9BILA
MSQAGIKKLEPIHFFASNLLGQYLQRNYGSESGKKRFDEVRKLVIYMGHMAAWMRLYHVHFHAEFGLKSYSSPLFDQILSCSDENQ